LAITFLTWFLPLQGQELVVNFTFDTVCLGYTTHFKSTSFISDTANPPRDSIVALAWDLNGDGQFNDGNDTVNFYIYPDPGIHNVGLKAITAKGLAKAVYRLVPVSYIKAAFTAVASCVQEPVVFTNTTIIHGDSGINYLWRFGDGTFLPNIKNPQHFYPDTGTYFVKLVAASLKGCADSVVQPITVSAPPVIDVVFSGDTVMYRGDSLVASVVGTYDSIRWSTKATSYTILIKDPGHYSVKAYTGGCFGQTGFTVSLKERSAGPIVSNLFTPNGDGYNDRWTILNLLEFAPCQVQVFNRYGEQVFSSSDYQNNWDGMFNGKQLANDTYYYFLQCRNQDQYKGNVNILK